MKRSLLLILLGLVAISIWGCGKTGSLETDNTEKEKIVEDTDYTEESEDTSVPLPDPESGELIADQDLVFTKYIFRQLGVMEFTEQKGEVHTDKASNGMTYLVLFLEFENNSLEERYLDVAGFSAKLDGQDIETSFLINDPKNYPVFNQTVMADAIGDGYVVWEVPEDWEKLEYSYDGLAFSDNITFTGVITKDDLSEPDEYIEE